MSVSRSIFKQFNIIDACQYIPMANYWVSIGNSRHLLNDDYALNDHQKCSSVFIFYDFDVRKYY